MTVHYNNFAEYFVDKSVRALDITDFLTRYHKTFENDNDSYRRAVMLSALADFERSGCCILSHHQSRTGSLVAFYDFGVLEDIAAFERASNV